MEKIKKIIQNTFQGLPIVYSGSYSLKKQGMIDREVQDIDICFHKIYYALVKERIMKSKIRVISSNDNYPNRNNIIVLEIEGKHIDIFFDRDFSYQKQITIGNECYLHGYEILKKKLDLLMNKSSQVKKHTGDIINAMTLIELSKEENIESIEDIPF